MSGQRVDGDWTKSRGRVDKEWRESGQRVEDEWTETGRRLDKEWTESGETPEDAASTPIGLGSILIKRHNMF